MNASTRPFSTPLLVAWGPPMSQTESNWKWTLSNTRFFFTDFPDRCELIYFVKVTKCYYYQIGGRPNASYFWFYEYVWTLGVGAWKALDHFVHLVKQLMKERHPTKLSKTIKKTLDLDLPESDRSFRVPESTPSQTFWVHILYRHNIHKPRLNTI